MKLTRQRLRHLINEMIEAWDPLSSSGAHPEYIYQGETPEEVRGSKEYQRFLKRGPTSEKRALGLLSQEESESEKQVIRDYHSNYKKDIIKFFQELRKPPEESMITCLHSPGYDGLYTQKESDSLSQFISRFGITGRDQISTVMFPCKVTDLHKYFSGELKERGGNDNSQQVLLTPSFIMRGYPTMMNYRDMMTQTRSNLHPDLVKFQAGSGVSKSFGKTPDINNFDKFIKGNIISSETVLDNWGIKGAHFTLDLDVSWLKPDGHESFIQEQKNYVEELKQECMQLGMPLWITDALNRKTSRVV